MAQPRALLILFVSALVLLASPLSRANDDDLEEEIAFLEAQEREVASDLGPPDYEKKNDDADESDGDDQASQWASSVDERDVAVLKKENFSEFIQKNRFAMVEFYAPWCGHCKALAPEYAAAATELKGVAALAKVDVMEERELSERYEVIGVPFVFLFVDGVHQLYLGDKSKKAIVAWIKKKTGPTLHDITSTEKAEEILSADPKVVLGFLDSLLGPESEALASASRMEDDVNFYQTANPDIAKLFGIESQVKRPALVLLNKDDEESTYYDGEFSKQAIVQFVSANKVSSVITFSLQTAMFIQDNPIKNQLLLFATSNDSEKFMPMFREIAKACKGKILFVLIEMDNQDGRDLANYFSVYGDAPRVLAYKEDKQSKFLLDGELTTSSIKSFAEEFLADKLKPFYKSDPVPEKNDGDVKIVVGNNFNKIVLDESKDVLLEIYAPWCFHCLAFEPTYNRLGKYLRSIDSLIIAKMDGTTNEHSRAKANGFPTLLFFPAGRKISDPVTVDADRTVVELFKFLKKHASVPFKLQKPASSEDSNGIDDTKNQNNDNINVKDEL